ncbi:MAG: SMI1/KNR4 family protein [Clostridiales bacterium]|nr:SMI1/KNR4 family protein [Clostridiales bacterium]
MVNGLDELISSADGIHFIETKPEDLEKLMDLYGRKIPDILYDYLKKHMPADNVKLQAGKAFVYYGIERIIEENTNTVPGRFLFPMGLYTFASCQNGDCICFDVNDPSFPVYVCSKLLLKGGNEISIYNGKDTRILSYEYKNVLHVSQCLGSSFEEFVTNMIKWKKEGELKKQINNAYSNKQYEQAVEAFEANPDVELAYLLENIVIASYNNLKKYDRALAVLDQFKHRFENRKRIWYYFATYAYVGKEDCEKAEECIKAGIDECNREKKAKILKGYQYKKELGDFIYFQWACQRIRALRLLKDKISSDSKLPEIIEAFREMCGMKFEYEDEALILFEASAGKEGTYTIHLVRQTEDVPDEEYYQLIVDIEYAASDVDAQLSAVTETFLSLDGDFFEKVESSRSYALLIDTKPVRINIEESDIEKCLAEKDIKRRNNNLPDSSNSINANLTINRKHVSNEEELMALLHDDIVEMEIGDLCLHIEYSEDGHAFIGWIDTYNDEFYYFDNGSGNTESVELIVNVCPQERMMCYDPNVLKEIVLYFCEAGLRNPKYNWIKDALE